MKRLQLLLHLRDLLVVLFDAGDVLFDTVYLLRCLACPTELGSHHRRGSRKFILELLDKQLQLLVLLGDLRVFLQKAIICGARLQLFSGATVAGNLHRLFELILVFLALFNQRFSLHLELFVGHSAKCELVLQLLICSTTKIKVQYRLL